MNKPTSIPTQGAPAVALSQLLDATALAPQAVRVPAGHADTVALGPMFGRLDVTRA